MSEIIEGSVWKYRVSSFPYLTFTVIYVDTNTIKYRATNPLFNQSILERDKHSWFERFEPITIGNK